MGALVSGLRDLKWEVVPGAADFSLSVICLLSEDERQLTVTIRGVWLENFEIDELKKFLKEEGVMENPDDWMILTADDTDELRHTLEIYSTVIFKLKTGK